MGERIIKYLIHYRFLIGQQTFFYLRVLTCRSWRCQRFTDRPAVLFDHKMAMMYSPYTERGDHNETIRLLYAASTNSAAMDEESGTSVVAVDRLDRPVSQRRIGSAILVAMGCIAGVTTLAAVLKPPTVHRSSQSDSATTTTQISTTLTKLATLMGRSPLPAAQLPQLAGHTSEAAIEERIESSKSTKVSIEIIAEAMCPNCKEHSYLFEEHVMSKGEGLVGALDIKMKMMVIDGWNTMADKGMCEKGRWDCELGKYQLAGWQVDEETYTTTQKWGYSRCLFKNQPALIEHYVGSPEKLSRSADFMWEKVGSCAKESGMEMARIQSWVEEYGDKALFEGYQEVKEYDDPVWIKVDGHYVEYEADWLAAICVASPEADHIEACQKATKLTGVVANSAKQDEVVSKEALVSWEEEEAAAQRDVATRSRALFTADNDKVDVYIVAEAFCPNCKEHSYYMDKVLMTPQGVKSGVRDIMNIYMEQMVLDGWDSEDNTGICEKGKYDCELAKYNLCSEVIDNSVDNHDQHMWWDFVRCNYKHQDEILEMYKLKHVNEKMIGDITETCATDAGVDYDTIKTCATSEMGTNLLQGSYKRVSSMSMPVWIYVEGQKFAMHEDWLSAICIAYKGDKVPAECSSIRA